MRRKKKRPMTLLEVMIVIFIIGVIGSVIGYNMRGSMDQGKAFKTKEAITKVYNIIQLEMESSTLKDHENATSEELAKMVEQVLKESGLIAKPKHYLVDGWKDNLNFQVAALSSGYEIRIRSDKYERFCEKNNKAVEYPWIEEEESANTP